MKERRNRWLVYVATCVGILLVFLLPQWLRVQRKPALECKPVEGNYAFGQNINVKVTDNDKAIAYLTTAAGIKKLDVKVAFFPPTEAGFKFSGNYLSKHRLNQSQQNGMCIHEADTTIKYWVALSGKKSSRWY